MAETVVLFGLYWPLQALAAPGKRGESVGLLHPLPPTQATRLSQVGLETDPQDKRRIRATPGDSVPEDKKETVPR